MVKKKLLLTASVLTLVMVISTIPAHAWVYPNGSEDTKFETYGPHVRGILIKLYNSVEDELTAMDYDSLDFEDSALPNSWVNRWQNDSRFQLKSDGGEAGYYILDINKNGNPLLPDGSENPAYFPELGNPCSVLEFRQALAYMVNRSYITNNILSGSGLPLWTPLPAYMTTYVNSNIKPGGTLENLTYGGMQGNVTAAVAKLNAAGFLYIPQEYEWRFWDKNGDGHYQIGEEFSPIFYSRSDHRPRDDFASYFTLKLKNDPIRINVDFRSSNRIICHENVYVQKSFHFYVGGWILIGPDPDYLYDLYHSDMYWHPGSPPNYGDGKDALLDHYAEEIKFAPNVTYGTQMTMKFQERFAQLAWSVPLWSASNMKAYRRIPIEAPGSAQWKNVVNQAGFGMNSYWTFLNLMKESEFYPPIYATYGFATSTIERLNPFYSEWYWESEILNKIYDSCAARNPYDPGEWVPRLAKSWEVGTWTDQTTHQQNVKVRISLRSDLYWQDGTPISVADLAYTFVESSSELLAKGIGPPVWWPIVQFFKSYYILDPLNIEFLLSENSVWAVNWVLGTWVLPKHIWKPIVDASTPSNNIICGPQPDLNCIGSGPFRFVEYVSGVHVILNANTRSSVVHGITSPGYWQYCPVYVVVHTSDYRVKLDLGYPNTVGMFNFTVLLNNLWLNQSSSGILIVSRYIYVDNSLIQEAHNIPLLSCQPQEKNLQLLLTKCRHEIKVAVHIDGPAMLDAVHLDPWICQWINVTLPVWITIKQDIGGAFYQGAVVAPDCKVDGKDIAFASSAFNTVPGMPRWNSVADITGDYKVDGKDLANIARFFGKW
jgi:ABC-type transport system substrate-binding protein